MIITFCGHSHLADKEKHKRTILELLEKRIGTRSVELYFGGYGDFDELAYECGRIYKKTHPSTSLVFVTPYITESYQKNKLQGLAEKYDIILYPPIEGKPLRFAISYRNKFMVEKADLVIACVSHDWGGAFATYRYARKKEKEIFNLENFDDDK